MLTGSARNHWNADVKRDGLECSAQFVSNLSSGWHGEIPNVYLLAKCKEGCDTKNGNLYRQD